MSKKKWRYKGELEIIHEKLRIYGVIETAKQMNRSEDFIWKLIYKYDIKDYKRLKGEVTTGKIQFVKEYHKHMERKVIAEHLEIGLSTVYKILRGLRDSGEIR